MLITNFKVKSLIYKITCSFYQAADVGRVHPVRERSLRALQRTVDYIESRMPDALGFDSQAEIIKFTLTATRIEGYYLEFGVFTGGTIRFIARHINGHVIHGFDSFEGLPEAWAGFGLGRRVFDVKGRLPRVPGNVELHRGWFDETIPKWLATHPGPVAFIHIDCDIYTSTQSILKLLAERIVPGTVVLFDEYFNYPNWERHEYKAFQEFVVERSVAYTYLAYARQQVAVRIDSIGPPDS